jgi:hypothetical protein
VTPRARRNPLEGAFEWATPVGRGDHRSVGRAPCVEFRFFIDFKQDSPGCFRGPSGLSPTGGLACSWSRNQRESSEDRSVLLGQRDG